MSSDGRQCPVPDSPDLARSNSQKLRTVSARIVRMRTFTLILFMIIAVFSGYQAPALFSSVTDQVSWDVLDGTPTAIAQEQFDTFFPGIADMQTESLLISCSRCTSLVTEPAAYVVKKLVVTVNQTALRLNATTGWIKSTSSYYDFSGDVDPNPFLAPDGRTMLYQWRWSVPKGMNTEAGRIAAEMLKTATAMARLTDSEYYGIEVTGGGAFATHRDVMRANVQDSGIHAVAFLPVGLIIVGIRVGSVTLMLVPILTAAGSMMTSFAIVSLVCKYVTVNATAPALIAFFNIALSVDYSLFLLTRYADERRAGATWRPALEVMVLNSGTVVLISGSVITAASLSAIFLPGGFLGMAIATSTACISCMTWNLMLVPAIIGTCPGFFDYCSSWNEAPRQASLDGTPVRLERIYSCEASPDIMAEQLTRSPWFWWSSKITQWPTNLIVVSLVIALSTPLTQAFLSYRPSIDLTQAEPRGAPSTYANSQIRELFAAGAGCPSPLYVLVRPVPSAHCPGDVHNNPFFSSTCDLAQQIIAGTEGSAFELTSDNILGIAFHPKFQAVQSRNVSCLPWDDGAYNFKPDAKSMLTHNGFFTGLTEKLRGIYLKVWNTMVSADGTATMIAIAPTKDATSPEGFELVKTLRTLFANLTIPPVSATGMPRCQLQAYLLSEPSVVYDFVQVTLRQLPIALASTMLLAFVLVGCSYCALFLPLKLFLTVAMPIIWSYGVAVLVYQYGIADGLDMDALRKSSGFLWSIPVLTCTLLCGLGLDYDIFLFSRIWELRSEGYSNHDAIRLGVASTAGTITSAGLIFVLEFSGALLSAIPANNQMGAVIAIAVMIDITVVESCFVPALLSLGADLNWWPCKMPPASRSLDGPTLLDLCVDASTAANERGESFASSRQDEGVPMLFTRSGSSNHNLGKLR
eukprot:TRINITY_DN28276_c0_g2_i1.p1 TRINITY_DN28276_c0_g2~~TRINITY_DN28276_c0_g2_i1.p1  ORF type:complete len:919 (+),score=131.10 TRINITY_DN28276_c0_g2_i1:194-2950(+)